MIQERDSWTTIARVAYRRMRRLLSILLAIGLGLGPAVMALPANVLAAGDDSGLPACCRRNGVHHCTMPAPGGETSVSAPASCPYMPHALASTVPTAPALIFENAHAANLLTQRCAIYGRTQTALTNSRHGWPKRGPPSTHTA